jgi:hypothetical protein
MNQLFDFGRFRRALANDALRMAKPTLMSSAALFALTIIIYVGNFEPGHVTGDPPLNVVLFSVYLFAGGLLLTSIAFQDMHHPLERYQYLMLPISNLERFASRYLLTGPLLVVYFVVAFAIMDWTGNALADWLRGSRDPSFAPFSEPLWLMMRIYLSVHALMFLGAICFRSYQLIKTALTLTLVGLSLPVAFYVSVRIIYFDKFNWNSWEPVQPLRLVLEPAFTNYWVNIGLLTAFVAWILYMAYRCLKAHEVQNEL